MTKGDKVIVLANPLLWGVGVITRTRPDGHLDIKFGEDTETFHPNEVELLEVYLEARDLQAAA